TGMTAYEMMLSESQERMLMVLDPAKEAEAKAVFQKWDLDFAIVGETIAEDRFIVVLGNETKADLPLKALSGTAPEYDRPWIETPPAPAMAPVPEIGPIDGLKALIASPNHGSKHWVFEQYDHMVMGDTVRVPGLGGAGAIRVHGSGKALVFTCDVTPRYVRANAFEGGKQAVAEAFRNISATGAKPLATTDNLNFGNPEKPEIMGQFVGAIKGIGAACRALDMPIVSGNVSLYNETDGSPILPTPTIGAVGLIADAAELIGAAPKLGDIAVLVGETRGHLGQSALVYEMFGREDGDAPAVDLDAELRNGTFVRENRHLISAATDLGDGGLALAAFELAAAGNLGVTLGESGTAALFGEDQARYLLACEFDAAEALMIAAAKAGVPIRTVGHFGGSDVTLDGNRAPLEDLVAIYRSSFERTVT
ncbi:MAG: phosphoribosylformylglycinamidine synthase II, partial [Mangrovicoccus sp.]|nr:phosphoribosylformylglycinamidine synthase II [Mangrovicoccus sp.]